MTRTSAVMASSLYVKTLISSAQVGVGLLKVPRSKGRGEEEGESKGVAVSSCVALRMTVTTTYSRDQASNPVYKNEAQEAPQKALGFRILAGRARR